MANRPTVDKVDFKDNTVHKKKNSGLKDVATIKGKDMVKGYPVRVRGHKGKKPTVWSGTITQDMGGGVYMSEDLVVDFEEISRAANKKDEKDGPTDKKGRGQEDVSTTVSNQDNPPLESQPSTTPTVTTVE